MKKLIFAIIVIGLLGGAYMLILSSGGVKLGFLEGKQAETKRGDLVRPITASGKIEPASIVQIKGKASGEVVETPFRDGATVRKGDLIVRLDPVDEQNNVDRAQADYDRALIAQRNAELTQEEREKVGIPAARAKLAQAEARLIPTKYEYENQMKLRERRALTGLDTTSPREFDEAKARYDEAQALVQAATVEVKQAQLGAEMAKQEVAASKKTAESLKKTLDDALQRLKETKVYSPIDGMVLVKHVQIGELVMSGKTSFTGGTVLMEIADVSDIYAVVNVDEADIGDVRELAPPSAVPGYVATGATWPAGTQPEAPLATLPEGTFDMSEAVDITVESFPQEKFAGVIERIAPQSQLSQAIATFKVWIRIISDNRQKLVGLLNTQAEAHFTVRSVRDAILVSYDAIRKDPNSDHYGVFIVTRNPVTGRPDSEFRRCTFGIDNGIDAEVIEGLAEGEKVWLQLPQQTEKEKEAEEKAKAKKRPQ